MGSDQGGRDCFVRGAVDPRTPEIRVTSRAAQSMSAGHVSIEAYEHQSCRIDHLLMRALIADKNKTSSHERGTLPCRYVLNENLAIHASLGAISNISRPSCLLNNEAFAPALLRLISKYIESIQDSPTHQPQSNSTTQIAILT